MTCRTGSSVDTPRTFGCSGSTLSGRCLGGGGAVGEPPGGFGIVAFKEEAIAPQPEQVGEPIVADALCQTVFMGMHDSQDAQTADPKYALYLQNTYALDSGMGTRIIGRPGFVQTGTQLGDSGHRRVQGIYQFTKLDGTEYTCAIVGGKFYKYTWGTDTWTEDTPGSATISQTAGCYFTTFADVLIVSDGVNTPWQYDGSTDTVLTNCPVLYGPPRVYYAKLFGVKNSERSTIVWSIENDPTTGYEAGGYNDAWTLGQTDQDPIYVLIPSNEALYYLRSRSIGAVRGAVDADFQNSGTREGVSTSIGTKSPDGVCVGDNTAYFMDADNRIMALDLSSGRLDDKIWVKLQETYGGWDETKASLGRACFDPITGLALVGVVNDGDSECNRYVVIDTNTHEPQGIWQGWTSTAMATVKNASGQPVIMHGTANGYIYVHGLPDGSTWNDQNNTTDGGTLAISHDVKGSILGSTMYEEKRFLRWDILLWLETANALTLQYATQRGTPTAQTKSLSAPASAREYHISAGINGAGRWIVPEITHSNGSEKFGLERWCIQAVPYSVEPDVP